VPDLDYAVLCDYVRVEPTGVAHAIAAGIDTVWTESVPAGQNVGLLVRVAFDRTECGRPHRVEVIFQDADGQRLAQLQGGATPEWPPDHPPGWKVGALLGLNVGIPLPAFGQYSFEILLNDNHVKAIPLRVEQGPQAPAPGS
jgi:hypothetical protein